MTRLELIEFILQTVDNMSVTELVEGYRLYWRRALLDLPDEALRLEAQFHQDRVSDPAPGYLNGNSDRQASSFRFDFAE